MVTSHVGDFLNVLVIYRPSTNHLNESSLDKWLIVTFGSNKFLSTDTKINRNDVKNEKETEKWNWTFFFWRLKVIQILMSSHFNFSTVVEPIFQR